MSNNAQIISTVKADFSVKEAEPRDVAALLVEEAVDERGMIEEAVERDGGVLAWFKVAVSVAQNVTIAVYRLCIG